MFLQLLAVAEAPLHPDGEDTCVFAGVHIDTGIATVNTFLRGDVQLFQRQKQAGRVRFDRDAGAVARNQVKAVAKQRSADLAGKFVRLIGKDCNLQPHRLELVKRLRHALIGLCVFQVVLVVVGFKGRLNLVGQLLCVLFFPDGSAHLGVHPVADNLFVRFNRMARQAVIG